MSQMWHHKKPIRIFSDLKIVITTGGSTPCKTDITKSYPKFFGLEKCHKCGITKNLSEFFPTWKMSRMRHHKKPIRIFSDLKNVITENCAKKQSDPTLEPNRLKNSTKIVPKKQSDPTLEPNGLEKCLECGITKNQSEIFRTWKMSRMSANLTQLVGLEFCHGWVRLIFVPQKNLGIG